MHGEPRGDGREGGEPELVDEVVARLVRRGVVTSADLQAEGVDPRSIEHRLRRKRLIPAFRGVYFVGHPDPAQFAWEFAALKAGGDASTLFYRTAAVLWLVLPTQADPAIHLALSAKRKDRERLRFHQVDLPPDETRTIHKDLRVTTPARTLLDNADHPHLERMVADAIRRKLTTKRELEQLLDRHKGERNTKRLREILDEGPLWSASELERRMIELIRKAGLPRPESNLPMSSSSPDLVWREQRVLVELDSRGFHNDWIAGRADRAKDRTRTLQGWIALRFTTEDVRDHPLQVAAELGAALTGNRSSSRAA
jgi:very-short-patch-repair endonuclease